MSDQVIQYTEEMVGAGHPTKADTLNRGMLVEHNADGSHKLQALNPVGAVLAWPTGSPPAGWLECDGASLDRTTYADLFAVIGDDYGAADGSHFNLPDYRGRFLRGWAHGQSTDPDRASRTNRGDGTVGDSIGTKQADALQGHYHEMGFGPNAGAADTGTVGSSVMATRTQTPSYQMLQVSQTQVATNIIQNAVTDGANGTPRKSSETRPININVMYCIKY